MHAMCLMEAFLRGMLEFNDEAKIV
jgi:hypothetical protein